MPYLPKAKFHGASRIFIGNKAYRPKSLRYLRITKFDKYCIEALLKYAELAARLTITGVINVIYVLFKFGS